MINVKGLAHFSIPVSDVEKSIEFYTKMLGFKWISSLPDKRITFLDAGGACVLLIKRPAPIQNGPAEGSDGVHHAFIIEADHFAQSKQFLIDNGVEIFFEEDRRGGVVDGPRFYFRDPDGTPLELIDRTAYNVNK